MNIAATIIKDVNIRKAAMYVGGALILIILFLYVRKKVREAKEENRTDDYLKLVEDNIVSSDLNYSQADYQTMANTLYQHFSDTGLSAGFLGVNQKGVYDVMSRLKSDSDYNQLAVAFGSRKLKDLSIAGTTLAFLVREKPYTLTDAMTQLLTNGERKKVNKILKGNGLTIEF